MYMYEVQSSFRVKLTNGAVSSYPQTLVAKTRVVTEVTSLV